MRNIPTYFSGKVQRLIVSNVILLVSAHCRFSDTNNNLHSAMLRVTCFIIKPRSNLNNNIPSFLFLRRIQRYSSVGVKQKVSMSLSKGPSVVSPPIIKSPLDKREYRGLTLNNKIKVLLISDSLTDKAAASLSVAAGGLSDGGG